MGVDKFRVIIVGGGPVGVYMAQALSAANIDFVVLEQQAAIVRPDAILGTVLFLWPHTARLCDQLGLLDKIKGPALSPLRKDKLLGNSGRVISRSYFWSSLDKFHGYSFDSYERGEILKCLYENLPEKERKVRTGVEVTDIESHESGVRVHLQDGSVEEGSIVIGADGIHSKTRAVMRRLAKGPSSEDPMTATYRGIFSRAKNDFGIENQVFFESHNKGTVTQSGAQGDVFYFGCFSALPKPTKLRQRYTAEDMEEFAASVAEVSLCPGIKFKDVWAKADKAASRLIDQHEGYVDKWHHDRIVLVGDSVHKMTSVAGLGVNSAMHSAAALANELQALVSSDPNPSTSSLSEAFSRYQKAREEDAKQEWKIAHSLSLQTTWKSWRLWFWDRFVEPWIEDIVMRPALSSVLKKGHILNYVPFTGRQGSIPWKNKPNKQLNSALDTSEKGEKVGLKG
ncbi:hypothetical protein F5B20DRAFT_535040 [Whalleya microplaca]|nr:hypothetical protein F5B20DRAFT_535040 [Whalleya microplaca]